MQRLSTFNNYVQILKGGEWRRRTLIIYAAEINSYKVIKVTPQLIYTKITHACGERRRREGDSTPYAPFLFRTHATGREGRRERQRGREGGKERIWLPCRPSSPRGISRSLCKTLQIICAGCLTLPQQASPVSTPSSLSSPHLLF